MISQYKQLQQKLTNTRRINSGSESPEEDVLLEEMDDVWQQLTDVERQTISSEPPRGDQIHKTKENK